MTEQAILGVLRPLSRVKALVRMTWAHEHMATAEPKHACSRPTLTWLKWREISATSEQPLEKVTENGPRHNLKTAWPMRHGSTYAILFVQQYDAWQAGVVNSRVIVAQGAAPLHEDPVPTQPT